jgi:hypothetical protein
MSEPLEPFDADLDALLDTERNAPVPGDALQRVWSRVGVVAPPAPHGWLASHAASVAATAFVVGGVVGTGVYAAVQRPPVERIVYVDRVVASAPVAPKASVAQPFVATSSLPIALAPPPVAAPSTRASPAPPESLSAERAMLDEARSALARGDAANALNLLEAHAYSFHKPQLAEEREAIAVQTLVALGRYDDARARAARFKEATPNSLFLPAVEAAVASIP